MQNEKKRINLSEKDEAKNSASTRIKMLESYEKSRNVTCFNCQQKNHYANECSEFKQSREMKSSSITTQAILSQRDKHDHLAECVLSNQIVVVTTRSEEVRKKEVTAQVKKKKIIFKKNERINEVHDKYLKSQSREQKKRQISREKDMKEEREANMKKMSRMNQYEKFHDFEDDEKDKKQMMKYFEENQ
jgi:hypothetical protein